MEKCIDTYTHGGSGWHTGVVPRDAVLNVQRRVLVRNGNGSEVERERADATLAGLFFIQNDRKIE